MKQGRPSRIPDETKQDIIKAYANDGRAPDIAEKYGVSQSTVYKLVRDTPAPIWQETEEEIPAILINNRVNSDTLLAELNAVDTPSEFGQYMYEVIYVVKTKLFKHGNSIEDIIQWVKATNDYTDNRQVEIVAVRKVTPEG